MTITDREMARGGRAPVAPDADDLAERMEAQRRATAAALAAQDAPARADAERRAQQAQEQAQRMEAESDEIHQRELAWQTDIAAYGFDTWVTIVEQHAPDAPVQAGVQIRLVNAHRMHAGERHYVAYTQIRDDPPVTSMIALDKESAVGTMDAMFALAIAEWQQRQDQKQQQDLRDGHEILRLMRLAQADEAAQAQKQGK